MKVNSHFHALDALYPRKEPPVLTWYITRLVPELSLDAVEHWKSLGPAWNKPPASPGHTVIPIALFHLSWVAIISINQSNQSCNSNLEKLWSITTAARLKPSYSLFWATYIEGIKTDPMVAVASLPLMCLSMNSVREEAPGLLLEPMQPWHLHLTWFHDP
jgi:hypothetical protein